MAAFTEQLRRHSVALISLTVALTSLAYNTWRNEQTEANRNVRAAGIELLLALGELEQVVFFLRFDTEAERATPREGWAYILTTRDLAKLTDEPAMTAVDGLFAAWSDGWELLGSDGDAADEASDRISAAIDDARSSTLTVLAELD